MNIQILEGTFAEVQQRLSALPLKPDTQLRVLISEADAKNAFITENLDRRDPLTGLLMLPAPGLTTLEEVRDALYKADMEDGLGENWERILQTLQGNYSAEAKIHKQKEEQ